MRKRKKLQDNPSFLQKNACQILGIEELYEITSESDLRLPEFRREYFLRFYGFHLKYKSHPGCVYFLFPEIFKEFNFSQEERLWFCFLNGCTQNPCTTFAIFSFFPDIQEIKDNMSTFKKWHDMYWRRLDYDTDKRYSKGKLVSNVQNYLEILDGRTQVEFFEELCPTDKGSGYNFQVAWQKVMKDFYLFGRLGSFSYLEYLKIAGVNLDCNDLFFDDISGSKSHRNGMLKVLGRDEWELKKTNKQLKTHPIQLVEWVEVEAEKLLNEAKSRYPQFEDDVCYFTLESALCTFKSQFRQNRRYPNVYVDMLYYRIKKAEKAGWDENGIDFQLFWDIRKRALPSYLLLEENPNDPGLCPEKQNHFRETGRPVMMWRDDLDLVNSFNKKYYAK